jgi:hypothetical protein
MTAPTLALDVATARAATDRLRLTLTDAHEQLIDLYRMRAHEALGYGPRLAGWTAYLAAEFGELLSVVPTAEQLAAMVDAGLSQREAAAPFRVSVGTVNAALKGRRAPAAPAARRDLTARIVDLLADTGPLDVFAVAKRLKVRQAQVSPALSRLARARRISYTAPEKRGQTGRYTL